MLVARTCGIEVGPDRLGVFPAYVVLGQDVEVGQDAVEARSKVAAETPAARPPS
jgi:hypothetical protein